MCCLKGKCSRNRGVTYRTYHCCRSLLKSWSTLLPIRVSARLGLRPPVIFLLHVHSFSGGILNTTYQTTYSLCICIIYCIKFRACRSPTSSQVSHLSAFQSCSSMSQHFGFPGSPHLTECSRRGANRNEGDVIKVSCV